jgi:drug/metabolite transporter (DMT)-like permease
MWALLALGVAVLTSFNPILYKRLLKDTDPVTVVWGVILLALPLLAIFTFALTPQLPRLDWLFVWAVIASAGLNAIAHIASTWALKLTDVSLVTPLLTFSPVFTTLISALFLDEIPSMSGFCGIGLVLIGAYWINRSDASTGWAAPFKALGLTPGIGLVLLAGLLWAITPLLEKTAILHTYPESPRFAAFVVTALLIIILSPVVLFRGKLAIMQLAMHGSKLILASLIAGTAPVLGYTALSLGLVGYVTTLFRLSTLMTVVWSFLLLKEQRMKERLPGSLMMVIGAILLAT